MTRDFDALLAEADAAPVDGWDFSWLQGRATDSWPPNLDRATRLLGPRRHPAV